MHHPLPAFLLAFGLLPQLASAQDWIDYGQLLRDNADKVVVVTDANGDPEQVLDLGDGVTVHCSGGNCYGEDQKGAIGCNFAIMVDIASLNTVCPGNLDPEEEARLSSNFDRLGRFIEENAVPARPAGYARELLAAAVTRQGEASAEELAQVCARVKQGPEGDLADMLGFVASREFSETLDVALTKPRLPVMNPCL